MVCLSMYLLQKIEAMTSPLLASEIEALKKEKKTGKVFGSAIGVLLAISGIAISITMGELHYVVYILINVFVGAVIGYLVSMWINRKVNADLRTGNKEVKVETITDKEQVDEPIANLSETAGLTENPSFLPTDLATQKHYFLIGDDLIEVDKEMYQKVDKGEHIKVHMAQKSGVIFKVELLD